LHIIDTATGTGKEDYIAIEPVDVEVIPVEALTRPDGGIFEGPGEAGQVAELGIGLTDVELGLISRPALLVLTLSAIIVV
tara:strand:+ start:529 stop:768 length:240 start_codon:yes stop_codon:yes gene_type:complete